MFAPLVVSTFHACKRCECHSEEMEIKKEEEDHAISLPSAKQPGSASLNLMLIKIQYCVSGFTRCVFSPLVQAQ